MFSAETVFFFGFLVVILAILMFDLGVLSKHNHVVKFKEAMIWTSVWVAFAIGFYFLLNQHAEYVHGIENVEQLHLLVAKYQHPIPLTGDFEVDLHRYSNNLSLEFLTGYLIEYALSIDNIFVMIVIFGAFGVREKYYKRILFWGVLGALVMRFLFIFLGASLIARFHWVMWLFGAFLIYTGIRMLFTKEKEESINPSKHPVVKILSSFLKVFPKYVGSRFFVKHNHSIYVTPLFIALMVVEFTDVIFAFDSVPAIFSVTKDPYIVFFSNIFAILGLRSLFFVLSNVLNLFFYLKPGLGLLMLFIGGKMIFHERLTHIGFTTQHSLMVIVGILGLSIIASLLLPKPNKDSEQLEQ